MFIIWTGSKDELLLCLDILKLNEFNLKCILTCYQQPISFLDIQIFINTDGSKGSSLYRKPSAGNTISPATSSHPSRVVLSIPYSKYLLKKRNYSHQEDFGAEAKALQNRLMSRGYSWSCLKKAYPQVKLKDRETLIQTRDGQTVLPKHEFGMNICLFGHSQNNRIFRVFARCSL